MNTTTFNKLKLVANDKSCENVSIFLMSKKNILLTGGFGFVGTNLLLELSREYNIYVVDNFYKKDIKNNYQIYRYKCNKRCTYSYDEK